jgi:rubrerythrin
VKRLPFTDVFVDESVRGRRYLMACVMAEARHLPELRVVMRALAVHERVHFNNESARRKRLVLSSIAEMPISVFIAVAQRGHVAAEFAARRMPRRNRRARAAG